MPCSTISPSFEHDDAVRHAHRREAVRDDDRHAARHQRVEAHEDVVLGARVERRRRLVENEQLRVAHVGARERDLLPLAAGQIDAVVESAPEHLPVRAGQTRKQRRRERLLGGARDHRRAASPAAFASAARRDTRAPLRLRRRRRSRRSACRSERSPERSRRSRGAPARDRTRAGRRHRAGCDPRSGRRAARSAWSASSFPRRSRRRARRARPGGARSSGDEPPTARCPG